MIPYFERDGITLYHADNRDVLPELAPASFDLVFTSPPYNMGLSTGGGKDSVNDCVTSPAGKGRRFREGYAPSRSGKGRRFLEHYAATTNDALPVAEYEAGQQAFLRECWPLVKATGALMYNHKPRVWHKEVWLPLRCNPGLPLRQIIVWDRLGGGINLGDGHYCSEHEWIMVFAGRDFVLRDRRASAAGDVWRLGHEITQADHPAPFPVALPARAIATTGARSVLDPYAGSGSTLVAAQAAGVRAVGIEKNEAYCALAVRRLAQLSLPLGA